jgi:hypothetical protein
MGYVCDCSEWRGCVRGRAVHSVVGSFDTEHASTSLVGPAALVGAGRSIAGMYAIEVTAEVYVGRLFPRWSGIQGQRTPPTSLCGMAAAGRLWTRGSRICL